jgi:hypothetical protein
VWNEYLGAYKPTTTTVQVSRLATDPRCLLVIDAIAGWTPRATAAVPRRGGRTSERLTFREKEEM